jgi:homoaconitase
MVCRNSGPGFIYDFYVYVQGAEVGATTSTFPYTPNMCAYLHATGRGSVAWAADDAASWGFLSADEGAEYDETVEIV